jgi:hypothetical protein
MTAKKILITAAVLVVLVIYYYLYRDSFISKPITIKVTMRPKIGRRRPQTANGNGDDMVVFNLGDDYKLTSVEVTPLDELATNKYAHAVWELRSDSNSVPTSAFAYGERIHGMHPAVKGITADPLAPSTSYRILVKAGSKKGEHDFKTPPEENPAQ